MTPNARYAAAIDCLTSILDGVAAEKTLTNWARSNRYAGSKDRAAVRDIVFDCLRQKRSFTHRAGFESARGVIAGHILTAGQEVGAVFTGERFAADVLSVRERSGLEQGKGTPQDSVRLDVPDWIEPMLRNALGEGFDASLTALQRRAPLDLRVNLKKASVKHAQAALAVDDIKTNIVGDVPYALRVTENPRRVALSAAYLGGMVEIQDAGSQAVVGAVPLNDAKTVLDYCAGGGGKSLALAARAPINVQFDAFDQSQARMKDLPVRAKRAGVRVQVLETDPVEREKRYDLMVLDVPCSGTGAWRRNPDGKWRFTQDDLQELLALQADILGHTEKLVAKRGMLAYITCSLLDEENEAQVEAFLKTHNNWEKTLSKRYLPSGGTDGLFIALLKNKQL